MKKEEEATLQSLALMLVKLDNKLDDQGVEIRTLSRVVEDMGLLNEARFSRIEHKLDQLLEGGVSMGEQHATIVDDLLRRVQALENIVRARGIEPVA